MKLTMRFPKKFLMMLVTAASLMWAGAAEKSKQPKMALKIDKMMLNWLIMVVVVVVVIVMVVMLVLKAVAVQW